MKNPAVGGQRGKMSLFYIFGVTLQRKCLDNFEGATIGRLQQVDGAT